MSSLLNGPKSYSQLKLATQLSDRWLSKKLQELCASGIAERREDRYLLTRSSETAEADPLFMPIVQRTALPETKARLIAEELSREPRVMAVILFGSLAKGQSTVESDIDLLVVSETEMEHELDDLIYRLMFKYDVPVEAIFMTPDDLITNLQAETAFSFGLLEGYETLYDREGLGGLLSIKRKQMLRNWIRDEETGTWIRRKLKLT
jgi:predicted nucleotidyltransferase